MAQTATKRRKGASGASRANGSGSGKAATKAPAQSARGRAAAAKKRSVLMGKRAGGGAKAATSKPRSSRTKTSKLKPKRLLMTGMRKAVVKAVRVVADKALTAGTETARAAAERAVAAGRTALESGTNRRLPIFASIDVAVPLPFAWEQWMTFESFTEGVHRIEEVTRDGDVLLGRTAEPLASDWEAEIVDEREEQAFAWRSVKGSDCAGLATFHRLSDRLTRIELDLDVLPTNPAETVALSLHIAHKRAETELRRFKARVEFINPDVYEHELSHNGGDPEVGDDDGPDNDQ